MDVVAPRPVPRVPSPHINAPAAARDPESIVPSPTPVAPPESTLEDVLDSAPIVLPEFLTVPLFAAMKRINHVIFKSRPANPPEAMQTGAWHFAAIGDYGSGIKPLTDVTTNIARSNPDLVLTLGDNVYWNGTEAEYQRKWDPPQYFGDIRTNFPVMPALGNHDTNKDTKPYFDRFPELRGARFYSYDFKGVHFVSLNTNESVAPGSPQYSWLEHDLASTKNSWKVLYYHHPMYSNFNKVVSPLHDYLAPLVAKYGVDLLLAGHEHNYSRSAPMDATGTVEVVAGGGGQTLHPFLKSQPAWSKYRDVDFGHLDFEVRKDALVGRYVVRDGSVRDTFEVHDNIGTAGVAAAASGAALAAPAPVRVKPVPAPAAH